jgi:hypothetical protein
MSKQNTQADNNNYKKNLIKNSSCCGAISDAWVPSYPSLPIKIDTFSIKNQSSSDKSELESSSLVSTDNNFLRFFNRIIDSEDM